LNNCDKALKKKLIFILKNENKDKEKIKFVINAVNAKGGIDYATKKMFCYRNEALSILHEFPQSEVRDALEQLVLYTTDRNY
jgi:octaprenyl-diphosphate synthase